MIYLDNAATTFHKPPQVVDAVVQAMSGMGNAGRGAHSSSLAASRTVYEARVKAAALFGCPRADHVVFTCNSTEALNIAVNGCIGPGSHVISTDLEHNSVLRPLYRLEAEQGVSGIGGVTVYGDFTQPLRAAIVSLNIRDWDSGAVSDELFETYGIATRPGAHCAPRMHQALGTAGQGAVRFSFSWFNTPGEVDEAVRAVRELAG